MSKITLEDVEYVAALAQLSLDDATKERLLHEMSDILGYIDKLSALDTEGVDPMMHAMEMTNVFRADEVGTSLSREVVFSQAPEHDGEYFLVPKILETGDA
jgi:aspartyl-tRNA(Asn)/glutamyl-tRNA(Gln) amidotransferase subunit C